MDNQKMRQVFDIPHHANLFALIYRRATEMYGEKGAAAADEGTKLYGNQRGRRMAKRRLKDGRPLNMESYLLYGEWKDKNGLSSSSVSATAPVYCNRVQRCGWCDAWKAAGLMEYGKNYCTYVDKSLVAGFNPQLSININSVLSQGGQSCDFEWLGFKIENERQEADFAAKSQALGDSATKDFLYHSGHLLRAMKSALARHLGQQAAEEIREKAVGDFAGMYGEEMADALVREARQDFSEVDY